MEEALQTTSLVKEELTVSDVLAQVNLIQNLMKAVMEEGQHYGTIPGTKKPSLYKPGAEKLGLVFRLIPEFDVEKFDLPGGHREISVKCRLTHLPSGKFVGEGVGSCSSMEGKYRYRTGGGESTEVMVPKSYWDCWKEDVGKAASILKKAANDAGVDGDKFGKKKDESGRWVITTFGEKVEHDNPADYYNTILKMAKKRAHVDAMITATAASDIFTQDVEDLPGTVEKAQGERVEVKQAPPPAGDEDVKESQAISDKISKATKVEGVAKGTLMSIYADMNTALDSGKISKFSFDALLKEMQSKKAKLKEPADRLGE